MPDPAQARPGLTRDPPSAEQDGRQRHPVQRQEEVAEDWQGQVQAGEGDPSAHRGEGRGTEVGMTLPKRRLSSSSSSSNGPPGYLSRSSARALGGACSQERALFVVTPTSLAEAADETNCVRHPIMHQGHPLRSR